MRCRCECPCPGDCEEAGECLRAMGVIGMRCRGEVTLAMLVLAVAGCVATAWLEYYGLPLPRPPVVAQSH